MSVEELVLFIFEMVGTVAFAISGAMVAIKKRVDVFGVIVLSAMTALGGGIVRDILIGHLPPTMFSDYRITFLMLSVWVFLPLWAQRLLLNQASRLTESSLFALPW